jgi:hypothetical protein
MSGGSVTVIRPTGVSGGSVTVIRPTGVSGGSVPVIRLTAASSNSSYETDGCQVVRFHLSG